MNDSRHERYFLSILDAMAELSPRHHDRPALLLVKVGNQIVDRAEDALAAMGLSGRQYMLLAVLSSDAPPSQLELAGLCGLLPAQVVPVIDKLEGRGLVARTALRDRSPALGRQPHRRRAGARSSRPTRSGRSLVDAARAGGRRRGRRRPCRVLTIRRRLSRPSVGGMSVKPIPEGFHTVTPVLTVEGGVEALGFYERAFGAEVRPQARHGRQAHALRAAHRRLDRLRQRLVPGVRVGRAGRRRAASRSR